MQIGKYIVDGTCMWIIRDVRDGTPVGRPVVDDILRPSYIKRNGALVNRADYPTLVNFLKENIGLVTTEENWIANPNLWTWGDGDAESGTTIRVPNDIGRYEQLNDSIGALAAGLPNILGAYSSSKDAEGFAGFTGAVSGSTASGIGTAGHAESGWLAAQLNFRFDASKSNAIYGNSTTVTPLTVKRVIQMKY